MLASMQSFDVLDRRLNVLGQRFLEASAGTGKTFAIEHLVVRLIAEHGLALEQILAVTFTRAATRELRQRIRASLEAVLAQIEEKAPIFDYVRAFVEVEEGRHEIVRRLRDALATFDRAQIFTIHGFCFRMLQEFAFESNVPFDLVDPQEASPHKEQDERILAFFRESFKPPLYGLSQIEAVMRKFQYDLKAAARQLRTILERRSTLPKIFSFQESLKLFNDELKKLPRLSEEKLLEDLRALAPHFKRVDLGEAERQFALVWPILGTKECSEESFDHLLREKRWFFEAFSEENQKKRASLPTDLHYPGIFAQLRKSLAPILDGAKDPLKILIRVAHELRSSPQQGISFDELLHKMAENLESEPFCHKIRKRFRALIVDEFQDTDPLQWKIFQKLFVEAKEGPEALYLVGDPKQSIYRFRGADVYTYLKAGEMLGEHVSLSTNFRSEKPLVHALNTLFSRKAGGNWMTLPSHGKKTLAFTPVGHGKSQDVGEREKGAIHFFLAQAEVGREKRFPTTRMENEQLFPFIAKEIEELKEEGLAFREIAVLVKDRFQAERLQNFLKKRAIPSFLARGKSLQETAGFGAFLQLFEALCNPSHIKMVLAGPLFGLTSAELRAVSMNNMRAVFASFKQLCEEKGIARLFSDFFAYAYEGRTVLERVAQTEDLYRELRAVFEKLVEGCPCRTTEEILLFLRSLKAADEEKPLRTAEQEAISILTIHMSKGLEYEAVFALALASRHTHEESFFFVRDDEKERLEIDLPAQHLEEQDAEKMRQLYVALTRAKKRVYVPMAFASTSSPLEAGEGAPIELFFEEKEYSALQTSLAALMQEASITFSTLEKMQLSARLEQEQDATLIPPQTLLSFKTNRHILSFSSLAQKSDGEERKSIVLAQGKSAHTLPLGAETGVLLHTIFEKIFKLRIHAVAHRQKREQLIQEELEYTPLKEWESVIQSIVEKSLALTLPGISIPLSALPDSKMLQEMEFLFSLRGQLIKGFADLVFQWDDRFYLIDWKSNWLGQDEASYTPERLEQTMQENDYFLQGSIYAAALERYVKLFDKRPFDQLFGGAFYIFIRGNAVYQFMPQRSSLDGVI